MRYREYPSLDRKVSQLGFGCMRLPCNEDGSVNRLKTTRLLREAFKQGVNYYDTAYGYHGGQSEEALGHAVKPFRDEVIISTKNPVRDDDAGDSWLKRLDTILERLGTAPDILNLHSLNYKTFQTKVKPKRKGILTAARKAQEEGKFGKLAISSHDSPENMIKLLDTGEFVGITLQYNLLDRRNEPVIEHARNNDIAVIVMGPVAGGRLAAPSEKLKKISTAPVQSTPELAMRFVLANEQVTCAISGLNERRHLLENVKVASMRNPLTEKARKKAQQALEETQKLAKLYCTGCGYCMPCPHNVNIPRNFDLMNLYRMWGLEELAKKGYARLTNPERGGLKAEYCKECGECIPKCPQNIEIIKQLKETREALSS